MHRVARRMGGRPAEGGFTLVELLMVLVVGVILLTIGAPAFNDTVKNNRLVASMNALSGMLGSARAEAIAQRATVTICSSTDGAECDEDEWGKGWISFLDLDNDGEVEVDDGETVLRRANAVPGTISVALVGVTTVRYGSQGFATTGANSTFRLCDDRGDTHGRALLVSSTGRVSVATDTDAEPDGIVDDAAGGNIDCP